LARLWRQDEPASGFSAGHLHVGGTSLGEGDRAIDAKRRGTGSSLTLRWREMDSNPRSRCCKRLCWALPIGTLARSVEPPKVRSEIARIDLGGPPMAVPIAAGPMVRIRFPPAESQHEPCLAVS
jgi:hypothetical protein